MKNIFIQLFIVFIGILLCIAGYNGVKKYFYNNYYKNSNYVLAYNNYSNISFKHNEIELPTTTTMCTTTTNATKKITTKNSTTTKKTITTSKTTTTMTTTQTSSTTLTTTTSIKPTEVFENVITKPEIENDDEIIYDGLTLKELTEKLNKNLTSTLSNTGHYFANYYTKTGLDPYLAVAIVLQETGSKWTCSKLVRNCNNIGGIKGSPKCNGGSYKQYDSLESGINGYLDMLYKNYYAKGLTTPELINPKYATSTEWSINVNKYIESIKKS